MSNAVFPSLPGLAIDVVREVEFSTTVVASVTGRELRISNRTYPIYNHGLKFNFLRDTASFAELRALVGFFLLRRGDADNFLFTDPDDSVASGAIVGTGDGSNRDFQLTRAFGSYGEPVHNPVVTSVTVNGSSVGYTLLANGVVRTNTAPGNGTSVAWNGTYYFRSRFRESKLSAEKMLHQVWKGDRIYLRSALQDRL